MIVVAGIHAGAMLLPGPDLAILMSNALSGDKKRIFLVALGYATACAVHSILVISGLWFVVFNNPGLSKYLIYFGSAFFIFVGISVIKQKSGFQYLSRDSGSWSFAQGVIANISNIKAIVYFIALYSQFITVETSTTEKAIWIVYIFVLSLAGAFSIGLLILRLGSVVTNENNQRKLKNIVGNILVIIGIAILIANIENLWSG